MNNVGNLIFACWFVYYLYWIIAALFTPSKQKVKWDTGSVWWNVGIFLVFLLLRNSLLIFPHSDLQYLLSLLFVVIGMVTAIYARWLLAGNWSKDVALKKNQTLVTNGIYRYIRHPIYSGFLLMALGTAIYTASLAIFFLYFILLTFLWIKLRKEEQLLAEHFSKEYSNYQKSTKVLIPFIL